MNRTDWLRQSDKPLFEQLEWDKPERKDLAGKLLIVGGHIHALTAPAQSYMLASSLGIGVQKVCLPSKTKSILGKAPFDAVFLPSTPSGEFAKDGINELLEYSQWADTILLPGDVGRNSQTTLLLEQFMQSFSGQVIINQDALDTLSNDPKLLLDRPNTTIVATIAQLQKIAKSIGWSTPITFTIDLSKLIEILSQISLKHSSAIVTLHQSQYVVVHKGKVSTTKSSHDTSEPQAWRNALATHAAVYQTWYPTKPFEALTHCAFLLK
jgi:NAD(P)H-hydrate repair Nnr-like enzyme with NAD(P)H-hydrate dehydratase domain